MRHHKKQRKLGRKSAQRNALMKALAVSLILKGKIVTTTAKAKDLRPFVEKLITYSKKSDLSSSRLLSSFIGNGVAFKKIKTDISINMKDRKGGYTRIVKLPNRTRDASPMAIIELVK